MVGRHYANSETNCLHFLNSIGRWTIGREPIFFVISQRKHEIKKMYVIIFLYFLEIGSKIIKIGYNLDKLLNFEC